MKESKERVENNEKNLNKGKFKRFIMPNLNVRNLRYVVIWIIVIFLLRYFGKIGQLTLGTYLILGGLGIFFTYLNSES